MDKIDVKMLSLIFNTALGVFGFIATVYLIGWAITYFLF